MNNLSELISKDEVITLIKPYIKDIDCYLVGGCLRDLMSGQYSLDRDLIVKTEFAEKTALKIANNINGHFICLDDKNKIYRVVLEDKKNYLDISAMLEDNLEKDIQRRDLTINAMVFDINNNCIIDKCNAFEDFEKRILRTFNIQNFVDDPLRILRVFRFKAKYNFDISEEIKNFAKNNTPLLLKPAKERISTEIIKLFEGDFSDLALKEADECGILSILFPFVEEIRKIPPNTHHHLDLLAHSIETVYQVQKNYEKLTQKEKEIINECELGGYPRKVFLKIAAFMHDIGKPDTWTIDEETGRHRFIMHDDVGSKKCIPILQSLKFSKKQISYIQKMIKNHIYPAQLVGSDDFGEKAKLKYYRKLSPYFLDNIILAKADRLSALGIAITKDMVEKNITALSNLLEDCFKYNDAVAKPVPLLNGNDIMKLTGIPQSKELGNIVKAVYNEQLDGNISTTEEAKTFVLNFCIKR